MKKLISLLFILGIGAIFCYATQTGDGTDVFETVGIGTTTPTSKLHVLGSGDNAREEILISNENYVNGFATLSLRNDVQTWSTEVEIFDKFVIRDVTAIKTPFTINPDSTNDRIVISGDNVGIGDTSPDALLDVAGNMIVDGAITFGTAKQIEDADFSYVNLGTTPVACQSFAKRGLYLFTIIAPNSDALTCVFTVGLDAGTAFSITEGMVANGTVAEGAEGTFTITISTYATLYVLTINTGSGASTLRTLSGTATGTTYVKVIQLATTGV